MNRNVVVRKFNGKCTDEKGVKCDYLVSNLCMLHGTQLDPKLRSLRMCDLIFSKSYTGRP